MCDANCPCSKHGRTLDFPRRMTRASRIERLDYLKDQLRKRVVILDGAMGTQLQLRGLTTEQKPELAAFIMPDVLTAVHRDLSLIHI